MSPPFTLMELYVEDFDFLPRAMFKVFHVPFISPLFSFNFLKNIHVFFWFLSVNSVSELLELLPVFVALAFVESLLILVSEKHFVPKVFVYIGCVRVSDFTLSVWCVPI